MTSHLEALRAILPVCRDCGFFLATEPDGRDARCHSLYQDRMRLTAGPESLTDSGDPPAPPSPEPKPKSVKKARAQKPPPPTSVSITPEGPAVMRESVPEAAAPLFEAVPLYEVEEEPEEPEEREEKDGGEEDDDDPETEIPETGDLSATELLRKVNAREFERREAQRVRSGYYGAKAAEPLGAEKNDASEADEEEPEEAPASSRRRLPVLPATVPEKPFTRTTRPTTRGECADVPRPCPFVSCRHHLYLEVSGSRLDVNFPGLEPDEIPESCSLDVADQGPVTLEEIGQWMQVCRERIRQIEHKALRKVRRADRYRGKVFEEYAQDHGFGRGNGSVGEDGGDSSDG